MLRFTLKRVLQAIPVLFFITTITFFMIRFAPGGPFDSERRLPEEVLKKLNEYYHLNDPLWKQYTDYLWNLVQGDMGPSFKYEGYSVHELIASSFSVTAELGIYAILIAILIGIPIGIMASLKPNSKQDYIPMSGAMMGICLPNIVLGPILLLIFSLWLHWFPVAGWGNVAGDKVLPSITLASTFAAYIARITRGSMIEVLSQDYIRTARAKGLSTSRIVMVHGLRAGLVPVVSYLGPAMAGLLSGSFIVESVFQIPGLGRLYVMAAFNRDYTMVLGCTIFFAALIILLNLIADIILTWMNPRMRLEGDNK